MRSRADAGDSFASATSKRCLMADILPSTEERALEESSSRCMALMPISDRAFCGESFASTSWKRWFILSVTALSAMFALFTRETTSEDVSILSRSIIAAAPVGVGALISATKSAIVKSVSWPTADTTGARDEAIARATFSSLNGQRSSREPPPLATTTISTPYLFRSSIPLTIVSAAPSPCTMEGARMMSAGKRVAEVMIMSWMTAPVSEVTTPTLFGYLGSGLLRDCSNSPSASSFFFSSS